MRNATLILAVNVSCFLVQPVSAERNSGQVYKWQDEHGAVHYSTKPTSGAAQRADLPPIMRGEMKLGQQKLVSCAEHGGINCQAGADTDGSVICYDGFTGATNRFRFSCASPKLSIADISDLRADGTFAVTIRNAKSVAAAKPRVMFVRADGTEVALKGPEQVEAFGVGEFSLDNKEAGELSVKPNAGQLKVECANCPG